MCLYDESTLQIASLPQDLVLCCLVYLTTFSHPQKLHFWKSIGKVEMYRTYKWSLWFV